VKAHVGQYKYIKLGEHMKKFKDWYYEGNDFKESDDFKSQNFAIKGSTVEIILFYISLVALTVFSIIIWFTSSFHWKYLVLFIPTLIWIFLRSSRKNMTATASWIAAVFGAIGGAVLILLSKLLNISL
jgi:hypothetical protein